MKGYFSRIASQSGLRFSAQSVIPSSLAGKTPFETAPTMLEREETVLVRPLVETENVDTGVSKRGSTPERPAAEMVAPKPDRLKMRAETSREKVTAGCVPETLTAPVFDTTASVEIKPAKPENKELLPSDQSLLSNIAEVEPTVIVKTAYVKPSAKREQQTIQTQTPVKNASTTQRETELPVGKHYYSKTAEIIGGRDAEPIEAQTILLREIQQWVADGNTAASEPRAGEDCSAESVALDTERLETQGALSTREPEPGIVRIGEKRHPKSIAKEISRIEEQSFDLSIGTISVIIEGEERPQQPAPVPKADNQSNRHDRGLRRSGLGRNYL